MGRRCGILYILPFAAKFFAEMLHITKYFANFAQSFDFNFNFNFDFDFDFNFDLL